MTVYVAAAVAVHESVSVAGEVPNVTLAGTVHARPAGVEAETEVLTVPVKPLTAVSVIVEVAEAPESIWTGETAPADIVKSTK